MQRVTRSRSELDGGLIQLSSTMSVSIITKQKKFKIVKKPKPNPSTQPVSNTEEEEVEEHLTTKQFNIVKHILEYLPIADLTRSAQVSILWSEVGRVVRKQRLNRPYMMLFHGPFPLKDIHTTKELVNYFNNQLLAQHTNTAAVRLNSLIHRVNLKDPREWSQSKSFNYKDEFEPALWNSFQSKEWEPQVVLCFGTSTVRIGWFWQTESCQLLLGMRSYMRARSEHEKARRGKDHVMLLHEALFGRMGKVVPCLGILGNGILTTLADDSGTTELEEPRLPMMTCLAIPKFPGLRVKIFTFRSDHVKKYKYNVNKSTCKRILNICDEDNVKGIVLFKSWRDKRVSGVPVLVRAVNEYLKINPGVVVGGGEINDCFSSTIGKSTARVLGCGLVFCCEANVEVGVCVMKEPGLTTGNEKEILKFKEGGMDKNAVCSFALVFSSKERGLRMHGHEDAETSLFRRHYPNTPIIGAFTDSEWVREYTPAPKNISGEAADNLIVEENKTSTVFMFVSCKHPA